MTPMNSATVATQTAAEPEKKLNYFQKIWFFRKYFVVEICLFFYAIPSTLNTVALQRFPLEKACRVNLKCSYIICKNSKFESDIVHDDHTFENTTMSATPALLDLINFNCTPLEAEERSQQLTTVVSGIRAPIAAIFPLIILLFASGWSDRYSKRKTCMILPIVGEALSFGCLLISAIFFESIPMQFGAYLEVIIPALFGGFTFFSMAVYSYMTITTPEENRVFRFGIYAMVATSLIWIGTPLSGYLFTLLGYIGSFLMAVCFQTIAILYIIFFIKEIKPTPKVQVENAPSPLPTHGTPQLRGAENVAYETTHIDDLIEKNKVANFEMSESVKTENVLPILRRGFFREFFDPTLVRDIIKLLQKKRPDKGRMILILLIIANIFIGGPYSNAAEYWFRYTSIKLRWSGNEYSFYETFSAIMVFVGTFIGTTIFSKLLKFSDPAIGLLSTVSLVCSRAVFAFTKDIITTYIGGILEMFLSLGGIAINAIGLSIVDGEEISKIYSVFSIFQQIGQFIFPPIYSAIYEATVKTFPGAIFLFSEIFHVSNVLLFIYLYFILRRNKNKNKQNALENDVNGNTTKSNTNPDCEITSL